MSTAAHVAPDPYPTDTPLPEGGLHAGGSRNDAELAASAAAGDASAWAMLVERLQPSVWAATGAHGLSQAEAATVCELVWLRLAQNLDHAPEPVRPWLVALVEAETARLRGRGAKHGTKVALSELIPVPSQAR